VRNLEPGEILIRVGSPNEHLFAVLEGRLTVHLVSAESAPIAEIGAGECVGELSVIDRQPTSVFVVALTACRVLIIDEPLLWTLVNSSHAIASNLLYGLTKRLRFGNTLLFANRERMEQYQYHATVDALTGLSMRLPVCSIVIG
jgi:CRP-like cAMP-binding protein